TGRSTNIGDEPFTISDLASDIIGLMDCLEIRKFHALGFSYGGRVVQTLLSEHPERIEKAILASTICKVKKYPIREYRRELSSKEFVMSFLEKFFTSKYIQNHPKEIKDFLTRAVAYETSFKTYQLQLQAILSFQGCEALERIKHEVLVIHGTSDSFIPPVEGKLINELLEKSTLYLVEDTAHLVFDSDRVKEISEVILQFLKES
ncbi:MAG: alpha/beta fold hydrolase, partial [Candidatus Hodarchaeales archaeon]